MSIKHIPKRKKKVIAKKFLSKFVFFTALFVISFLVLLLTYYRAPIILSPIPSAVSHVLSAYIQRNPDGIIIRVKDELSVHHIIYTDVSVEGSTIHIQLENSVEAILSTDKDISVQLDSLQYTIAHLTIEGKRIARVDMRFERPVVTFQ